MVAGMLEDTVDGGGDRVRGIEEKLREREVVERTGGFQRLPPGEVIPPQLADCRVVVDRLKVGSEHLQVLAVGD